MWAIAVQDRHVAGFAFESDEFGSESLNGMRLSILVFLGKA
jgi:hypothetical protein